MKNNRAVLRRRLARLDKESSKIARKLEQMDTIGWRAITYGDEYDYGGYVNYLFKDYARREAKKKAEAYLERNNVNGGRVGRILRGQEKYGRVH